MEPLTNEKNDVWKLRKCIEALSEYHNKVSIHFKGLYPSRPYETTLELFKTTLNNHISNIAVIEEASQVIDFSGNKGKWDYLIVFNEYCGKSYGKLFMDLAMHSFDERGIQQIEVKVVDGNGMIHLYEKYGFKVNAHLLVCT